MCLFLIYDYLERAASQDRKRIEAALEAGDMAWHGLPFTTHSELMDASLFRYGLELSRTLDRRFGKQSDRVHSRTSHFGRIDMTALHQLWQQCKYA